MNAPIVAVRLAPAPQPPPPQAAKSAASAANPSPSATGAQDFARSLDRASAKPSRKEDSAKSAGGKPSGEPLPPAGSGAPPATAAPVPAPAVAPPQPQPVASANGAPVLPSTLDAADDGDSDAATPAITGAAAASSSPAAGTSIAGGTSIAAVSVNPR